MDDNEEICSCFGLTVKDIKDAIENGASSYDEVVEATNVGTACGACIDSVKELVEDLLQQK